MALFDDLTKKAAKFTEEAIDKTQEFAGTAKIKLKIKNSIFRNSLIFQGLPPIKYQNLMYFPLFLPL